MRFIYSISSRHLVLLLILGTVVGEVVLRSTGFHSVVQGTSMYPTFKPNDVIQTRAANASPQRGDVVIMVDDQDDRMIKRIIGLPGELVTLRLGFVYINGQRLSEPYLPRLTYTFMLDNQETDGGNWQLGDNQFFVLGDNRLHSDDSRKFGPVELCHIRRIVNLPENSSKPEFCDIILTVSGMPKRKSQLQPTGSL